MNLDEIAKSDDAAQSTGAERAAPQKSAAIKFSGHLPYRLSKGHKRALLLWWLEVSSRRREIRSGRDGAKRFTGLFNDKFVMVL